MRLGKKEAYLFLTVQVERDFPSGLQTLRALLMQPFPLIKSE